jgi:hypothetical protein
MLEIVDNLEDRVEAVADGVTRGLPPQKKKPAGGVGGTSTVVNISSDADPGSSANPFLNMEQSEASEAFRQEFEARKAKQDKGLDVISRGLGVLKDIGGEMTSKPLSCLAFRASNSCLNASLASLCSMFKNGFALDPGSASLEMFTTVDTAIDRAKLAVQAGGKAEHVQFALAGHSLTLQSRREEVFDLVANWRWK